MDQKALKRLEKLVANTVTKQDLKKFATKDDLKKFATKDDLEILGDKITDDIASVIKDFMETVDRRKADRDDVLGLERRVEHLEDKLHA